MRNIFLTAGVAALIYGGLFLSWWWTTPLGQVGSLDGRENFRLAREIAEGTLRNEPFYRSPAYALVLAGAVRAGVTAEADLMILVGLLGLTAHVGGTLAVTGLARKMWRDERAGLAAGLLWGLYPVAVHFAADALDTGMSLEIFLLGLWATVESTPEDGQRRRWGLAGAGGLALAVACMMRPNLLPGLIMTAGWLAWTGWETRKMGVAAAWTAAAAVVGLAFGLWQFQVCGKFGILPWQGAYNLWVGNGPQANGRYYVQRTLIEAAEGENPARVESEQLYTAETGRAADDPAAMSAHWRNRTLDHIKYHSLEWIELMGRKVYYLFNDWEQYNNRTYAFHKERAPLLRWNPLGWGVVFGLAAAALAGFSGRMDWRLGLLLAAVGAGWLGGATLFFAGDRFRLPLAPLCCAMAGGLACVKSSEWRQRKMWRTVLVAFAAWGLAFSRLFGVRDTSTFIQDKILLASASLRCGDDAGALEWAKAALAEDAGRPDAAGLAATAEFNLYLTGAVPSVDEINWQEMLGWLERPRTDEARLLRGVVAWRLGRREEAATVWRTTPGDAGLGLLALSGQATPEEQARLSGKEPANIFDWVARTVLEEDAGTGTELRRRYESKFPSPAGDALRERVRGLLR